MAHIKAYKQLEFSDCGITCIRIITKYYGREFPLKMLRSLCDTSKIGVSLSDIVNCAKSIGLESTPIMVSSEEVYRMPLPAILHWEQNHYVVLYKIDKKNKFYIADPAQGKVSFEADDFFNYWKGCNERGISIALAPSSLFYEIEIADSRDAKAGLLHLFKSALIKYRNSFF